MNEIPFLLELVQTTTANGTATLSYSVPPAQDLYLYEFVFASTGAFNLTNIRNSNGRVYSNISTNNPITSTLVANNNTNVQRFQALIVPLFIAGSEQILIDLLDTSAAPNTIRLLFNCKMIIKAG